MNQRGLFRDLARIARGSVTGIQNHLYVTPRDHRMHVVCSTLESLGYMERRPFRAPDAAHSAWSFTDQGIELFEDLRREEGEIDWEKL